jgi:hypothetical protein
LIPLNADGAGDLRSQIRSKNPMTLADLSFHIRGR